MSQEQPIESPRDMIRRQIEAKKQKIESDNPNVEIARMNIEAVAKLADDHNGIFSELKKDSLQDETLDYALAKVFAENPLKSLEERLKRKGIKERILISHDLGDIEEERDIKIEEPLFKQFLIEFKVQRHCLNRGRVTEYITALDKANAKDTILQQQQQQEKRIGLLGRLG